MHSMAQDWNFDNIVLTATEADDKLRVRAESGAFCSFYADYGDEDEYNIYWEVSTFRCRGVTFLGEVIQHNQDGVCELVVILDGYGRNRDYRVVYSRIVPCS